MGSLIKSLKTKSIMPVDFDPSTYRGEGLYFWDNNWREHVFKYAGRMDAIKAYQKCSPLTSIINRKAQAYINGKTYIMNTMGKEAKSREADKLRKLLARPNYIQTWKQFEAQQQIYIQLFGFCITMAIVPAGYEKYGPIEATSLWNIPPNIIELVETNGLFYKRTNGSMKDLFSSIKLTYGGETVELIDQSDNLYIFKDITPCFNTILIPDSRVLSLEVPINNIIGAMESRNVLINNRGANGIFSHDPGSGQFGNLPMTPLQKEELQNDFKRYGLRRKQWQYIITTAALKWQSVGHPTKDLLLMEEVQESSVMICDGYNYPPHLMGLIDPTFNNQNTAEKGLYNNAIIPEADSNYEQWNILFRSAEYNLNLIKDYSHLPVLQENDLQKAQARKARNEAYLIEWNNDQCTRNEWRLANGDDPIPDGNVYKSETNDNNSNQPGTTAQ